MRRRPEQAHHPVPEHAARVARSAHEEVARRGVRDAHVSGDLGRLAGHDPDDQRGAEQHEHVTRLVGPGHELLGHRVDATRRERGPVVTDAARLPPGGHEPRQLRRPDPEPVRELLVPPHPVEQRVRERGRGRVEHRLAAQRVVGHRLRGPEAVRARRLPGQPAHEPEEPARRVVGAASASVRFAGAAAVVAVQHPEGHRRAGAVDRGERRHHRRHAHAAHVEVAELRQTRGADRRATRPRHRARSAPEQARAPRGRPARAPRRCRRRRPRSPSPTTSRCRSRP